MKLHKWVFLFICLYSPFILHSEEIQSHAHKTSLNLIFWVDDYFGISEYVDFQEWQEQFHYTLDWINQRITEDPRLKALKTFLNEYTNFSLHSILENLRSTFDSMYSKLNNKKDDSQFDYQGIVQADLNSTWKHNFASSSGGAHIVQSPKMAVGASNLLTSSADKYMIIPWTEKKNFVISLSEDAVVDKFMIFSGEEYSSNMEMFSLYGSGSYDSENQQWEKLGSFMANEQFNGRWQSFKVPNTWVRYLKIEWKTTQGAHKYCTLTSIKVCGRTMVQGLIENLKDIDSDKEENDDKLHEKEFLLMAMDKATNTSKAKKLDLIPEGNSDSIFSDMIDLK